MDYFRGAAQSSYSFVNNQVHQRLVQLCIFAAILFWFLGSYDLIGDVQKLLNKVGLKFGKDSTRAVHAVIFGFLLYVISRFIMDPIATRLGRIVEGSANGGDSHENSPDNHSNGNNFTLPQGVQDKIHSFRAKHKAVRFAQGNVKLKNGPQTQGPLIDLSSFYTVVNSKGKKMVYRCADTTCSRHSPASQHPPISLTGFIGKLNTYSPATQPQPPAPPQPVSAPGSGSDTGSSTGVLASNQTDARTLAELALTA